MPVWHWVRARMSGTRGRTSTTRIDADREEAVAAVMDLLVELKEEIRQIRRELDATRSAAPLSDTTDEPPAASLVDVRVLGGFSVAVGGHELEWTGRRASRNLFQLLLQRHPQPVKKWHGVRARSEGRQLFTLLLECLVDLFLSCFCALLDLVFEDLELVF